MKKLLFCLGVSKGGTTWLHWVLTCHPDVVQIPRKEIHYFFRQHAGVDRLTEFSRMQRFLEQMEKFRLSPSNTANEFPKKTLGKMYGMPSDGAMVKDWSQDGASRKRHRRLMKIINWYRDYLRGPVNDVWFRRLFKNVGDSQWAIDFSTTGFLCKDSGIKDMAGFADDTRAIIILRDPVDRLWSHVKFHAQVNGKLDELRGWSPERIWEFVKTFDLHTNSFYAEGVEAMVKHFPEGKRMIIDFADLRTRPEDLLQEVLVFMDLPTIKMPSRKGKEQRINVSKPIPMPEGLFEKFLPEFEADLKRVKACGVDFVDPWIEKIRNHGKAVPKSALLETTDLSATLPKPVLGKV